MKHLYAILMFGHLIVHVSFEGVQTFNLNLIISRLHDDSLNYGIVGGDEGAASGSSGVASLHAVTIGSKFLSFTWTLHPLLLFFGVLFILDVLHD